VSVIGFCPTLLSSPSGVVGHQPASRASHCLLTDRSVHSAEELKILLLDCCSLDLEHCAIMSLEQGNNTDASGSSSGEWDGLASPDVLRKCREPKWYMERGYAGPYRGLGIPHRPTRGQAAATAQGACARARRAYHPRRCGLCYHGRMFDMRTGLNNHASQQHGYYYSLKGDCFVPLGGTVCVATPLRRQLQGVAASAAHAGTPVAAASLGVHGPRRPAVPCWPTVPEGPVTLSGFRRSCGRVS